MEIEVYPHDLAGPLLLGSQQCLRKRVICPYDKRVYQLYPWGLVDCLSLQLGDLLICGSLVGLLTLPSNGVRSTAHIIDFLVSGIRGYFGGY